MKKIVLLAALAASLGLAAPATAAVDLCAGIGCTPFATEKVNIAAGPAPIIGVTETSNVGVAITSPLGDNLIADGFNRVYAADGLLNSVKFSMLNGNTFGAAELDLSPLAGFDFKEAYKIILTWNLANGASASEAFLVSTIFENFGGIFGTAGERFTSVEFVSDPITHGWGELSHLRLGDIKGANGGVPTPQTGAVPEPMTWITMILGFAFIGSMLRRQRAEGNKRVNFA